MSKADDPTIEENEQPRCRLCGQPITEPEYEDTGLCGDCYWDDQTDSDGTVGDG